MFIEDTLVQEIRTALSVNGQEPNLGTAAGRAWVQLNRYADAQAQHGALMEAFKNWETTSLESESNATEALYHRNQSINALRQKMRKNLQALQQELESVVAQGGEHVVPLSAALGKVLLASEALDYRWTDRVRVKPKTGSLTID